jgi:hypothetical protein
MVGFSHKRVQSAYPLSRILFFILGIHKKEAFHSIICVAIFMNPIVRGTERLKRLHIIRRPFKYHVDKILQGFGKIFIFVVDHIEFAGHGWIR